MLSPKNDQNLRKGKVVCDGRNQLLFFFFFFRSPNNQSVYPYHSKIVKKNQKVNVIVSLVQHYQRLSTVSTVSSSDFELHVLASTSGKYNVFICQLLCISS